MRSSWKGMVLSKVLYKYIQNPYHNAKIVIYDKSIRLLDAFFEHKLRLDVYNGRQLLKHWIVDGMRRRNIGQFIITRKKHFYRSKKKKKIEVNK